MPVNLLYFSETTFHNSVSSLSLSFHATIQLQLKIVSSLSPPQWDGCNTESAMYLQPRTLQHFNWGSKNKGPIKLVYLAVLNDLTVTIMRKWQAILHPLQNKICPQISVHCTNSEQNVLRTRPENSAIWKKPGHGNLLGRRDLQIVLDKILPIWNLASLWWNKAVLTTHLLTSPLWCFPQIKSLVSFSEILLPVLQVILLFSIF